MLTIAIPTYDRNATLRENLRALLPQLQAHAGRVRLLILDNASPTPVEETLRPLLDEHPQVEVEVARHRVNIGANANIMRCFEMCRTPWLWLLGDDDPIRPDALDTIFVHLHAHLDCVSINFSTDNARTADFTTRGLEELAHRLDTSADLPWISSQIYNAERMSPQIKLGYHYTYSLLPHVVTLLASLGEAGAVHFSTSQIVDAHTRRAAFRQAKAAKDKAAESWAMIPMALGFATVADLPIAPRVRPLLLQKLLLTDRGDGLKFRFLLHQLLLLSIRGGDPQSALYIYDQTCARRFYFDRKLSARLERFAGRQMLRFPGLTARVYRLVKRHEFGAQGEGLQDRYGRL